MHSPPILKTPWRMTQAEVEKYTHAAVTSMHFMKRAPTAAEIGVAEGWEFIADSKGETGMIATKAGSHVSFKLEPAVYETLLVGCLTPYEKITPVRVWVDHDAAADQTACRNPKLGKTIDPWHDGWIGKVSVYRSLPTRAPKGGGYVHFCLSEDNKGRFDDKTDRGQVQDPACRSPTYGCFYGCFSVIEAHRGTWFRTPCPIVVRSRSNM